MFLRLSIYWFNYWVIRLQLLLTLLVLWLTGLWLKAHYGQDDSSLWLVMNQFLQIIRWTIVVLFTVGLTTTVIAWLIFRYARAQRRVEVALTLGEGIAAEAGLVHVTISLTGIVIRPLLGSVRAKLVFSKKRLSDAVVLDTNIRVKKKFLRTGIRGTGQTLLHDRGIYDVEKVLITFCDLFNLVALPTTIPYGRQVYTLPKKQDADEFPTKPNSTEDQTYRINVPKRVEGEYINYKEFETGDNIRRIVWKIYAKSGQLVVRVPETKDPYASHLCFYASFFSGLSQGGMFDAELLNVYKDKVRNVFEALKQNGFAVRIPADQEVPRLAGMSDKKNELFQIATAAWQKKNTPASFVDPAKAAFVCVSALAPREDVEQLFRNLPLSTPVVVVKLSDAISSPFRWRIANLFFSPPRQPADKLRNPWWLSPLRQRIVKNENEIAEALERRGNSWLIDAISTTS